MYSPNPQDEINLQRKFGIHSLTQLITLLVINGLFFVSTKILTNYLSKGDYGIYSFWISFILFISGFCTAIFSASMWRYFEGKTPDSDRKNKSHLFTLSVGGSFILQAGIFSFFWGIYYLMELTLINIPEYDLVLLLIFFIVSLNIFKELILVTSGAEQKSKEILIFNSCFGVLIFAGSCIAAIAFSDYIAVLTGYAIGFSIPIAVVLAVKFKQYGITLPTVKETKKALKFGSPQLIVNTYYHFSPFFSLYIVNMWLSSDDAAILSIGLTIANILSLVLNSFLTTYRPYITIAYEKEGFNVTDKFTRRIVELFLAFSYPLLLLIVSTSPILIQILSNSRYLDALTIVPFTVISVFITTFSSFWLIRIELLERTSLIAIIYFIGFMVLTLLNLVFIPMFMLVGVGLALLSQSLVVSFLTFVMANSVMKFDLRKAILARLVILVSISVIGFIFLDSLGLHLFLNLSITIIIYVIMLFYTKTLTIYEIKSSLHLLIHGKI